MASQIVSIMKSKALSRYRVDYKAVRYTRALVYVLLAKICAQFTLNMQYAPVCSLVFGGALLREGSALSYCVCCDAHTGVAVPKPFRFQLSIHRTGMILYRTK